MVLMCRSRQRERPHGLPVAGAWGTCASTPSAGSASWRLTAATAVLASLLGLTATACSTAEKSARPQVVVALYPLEFVASKVAGTHADVTSLAQGAVEPHDQELTAKQRASLASATTVLYLKGMSPSVDDAVSGASNAVDVLSLLGDKARARDPHMWLNPLLLAHVGEELASSLADFDPANRAAYSANATALQASLTELDAGIREATASCGQRLMVTAHGAFAYFASRYKFRQVNVLGTNPEAQPSPAVIARIVKVMREANVSSVYSEVGGDASIAATLASETGARVRTLYPIEVEVPGKDYFSMMAHNRDQVVAGQGCRRWVGGGPSIATPDISTQGELR